MSYDLNMAAFLHHWVCLTERKAETAGQPRDEGIAPLLSLGLSSYMLFELYTLQLHQVGTLEPFPSEHQHIVQWKMAAG